MIQIYKVCLTYKEALTISSTNFKLLSKEFKIFQRIRLSSFVGVRSHSSTLTMMKTPFCSRYNYNRKDLITKKLTFSFCSAENQKVFNSAIKSQHNGSIITFFLFQSIKYTIMGALEKTILAPLCILSGLIC